MKKISPLIIFGGALSLIVTSATADDAVLPAQAFPASHYETLWTKSPFSVATPDAPDTSPDYTLVGVTQLDGVAYASVVDAHTQDHFVISTQKAVQGLKLISITHSRTGSDTLASVQKDGQSLTLKLQAAPAQPVPPAPGAQPQITMPGLTQNIPMPTPSQPGFQPGVNPGPNAPRSIRVHRPLIHLPPQPGNPDANAPQPPPQPNALGSGAPVTPESVQPHTPPPPQ